MMNSNLDDEILGLNFPTLQDKAMFSL